VDHHRLGVRRDLLDATSLAAPLVGGVGGLLAALNPIIVLYCGYNYGGGAVAVIGGALVFGTLRRIIRRPRVCNALLLGVGLAILVNSRPYEGLVMSLPVAVLLLTWMVGKNSPAARVSITRIGLPVLGVLAMTGGAMGFYNWRVTSEALRMSYQVHEATYAVAPVFLWPTRSVRADISSQTHTGFSHGLGAQGVYGQQFPLSLPVQ
jgi:hypothetical protein